MCELLSSNPNLAIHAAGTYKAVYTAYTTRIDHRHVGFGGIVKKKNVHHYYTRQPLAY